MNHSFISQSTGSSKTTRLKNAPLSRSHAAAFSGAGKRGDKPVAIKIHGANLNSVLIARLERQGSAPVALQGVASNTTLVTGNLVVAPSMTGGGAWDVVVADATGAPTRLNAALTISAAPAASTPTPAPQAGGPP